MNHISYYYFFKNLFIYLQANCFDYIVFYDFFYFPLLVRLELIMLSLRFIQARLAFCKFMVKPSTLLVLDEPTNHLDIPSKEMLEVWLFLVSVAIHFIFYFLICGQSI